jgi:hypothetical protein
VVGNVTGDAPPGQFARRNAHWAGVFLAILDGLDSSVNGGSK